MIHDNFKISGTGEALLDFKDPPRVQLKNDRAINVAICDTWEKSTVAFTENVWRLQNGGRLQRCGGRERGGGRAH